jgi:hypothetical protein
MSTLTVSNVSDGSLSVPTTYVTNGSAKAWVNLNGTGTIAARDSLNLSSLTDNGTGDYTVNFTNAFGAADYAAVSSTGGVAVGLTQGSSTIAPTTTAYRFISYNNSFALIDPPYLFLAIHGDLA